MKYDAVLEGGGAKIPGLIGALAGIESRGFTPSNLAGTSAGAIVAAGRIAGYTPLELQKIIQSVDFRTFKDGNGFGFKTYNILRHKGIYKGDKFYEFLKDVLKYKGIEKFGDIVSSDPEEQDNPKYRWLFKCLAADITNGRLVTWPNDAALYGMNPDNMEVALAVRSSMSIPYFYRPSIIKEVYFVDGGLLSNFPLWIWDSPNIPSHPTFGVLLDEEDNNKPKNISGMPFSFFEALFSTVLKAHDRRFIRPGDFEHRTFKVPTGNARTTEFDMPSEKKERLFHSGWKSATEFLDHWSWQAYIDWSKTIRGIYV